MHENKVRRPTDTATTEKIQLDTSCVKPLSRWMYLFQFVTRFKPLESLHTYFHSKKYGLMHRFEEAIIYERHLHANTTRTCYLY